MRKKFTLILLIAILSCAINISNAQSISPDVSTEFCPNTEITFSVLVPGTNPGVASGAGGAIITQGIYNTASSNGSTTFNFKGRFNDVNQKQSFKITYLTTSGSAVFEPEFKKIKSLFYYNSTYLCANLNVPGSVVAPTCTKNNIPISFSPISWSTTFEATSYCFGSVSSYEYILPAGWSMNGNTSNGNTPLIGGSSVTVTSDFSTGGIIKIRPATSCTGTLANGYPYKAIAISRPAGFVIQPANTTITCGSTTPITFNVSNVNNVGGITDHTWHLGVSPNGWLLPDGSPAPEYYSTGTVNTLTLTPVCGGKQGNVEATVTYNGTSCDAQPANIVVALPAMSIEGNTSICSGSANYYINNLPCNATVTWSSNPGGIISLPATGNPIIATLLLNQNTTMQANVVLGCGTVALTKVIANILDAPTSIAFQGATYYSSGQYVTVQRGPGNAYIPPVYGATSYYWSVSNNISITSGINTNQIGMNIFQPGTLSVSVQPVSSCGLRGYPMVIDGYVNGGPFEDEPAGLSSVSVYPNPTSSSINIEGVVIQEDGNIELYNFESNKLSLSQKIKKGTKSAKIQVSHLPKGKYVLVIRDKKGKLIKTQQVILK